MKYTIFMHSVNINKNKKLILLEAIEKNSALALISTNTEGVILSFNAAAEKMLGYTAAELIEKETPAIFHDLDEVVQKSTEFSKTLGQEIIPGFSTFVCYSDLGLDNQFEWTYVHKNGKRLLVRLSITTLYDNLGQKTGYLGIAEDITKLKEKEKDLLRSYEKLEIANEELTQFAYRTSHDLKAPLISSKRLINFIIEDIESGHIQNALENVKKTFNQMSNLEILVNDILNLVKADFDLEPPTRINIKELVDKTKNNLSYLVDDYECLIINEASDIKPLMQKVRLQQILENFISNGIKYRDKTKSQSFIKIQTSQEKEDFILVFEDNGAGIPEKYQDKVFDMFQRFHPKLSFGSGLGLSIAKKISCQ